MNFFSFFDYLIKENFKFIISSIVTNGFLLNYEITDALIRKYSCKSIQVTLDGSEETHNKNRKLKNTNEGTFKVIIFNLKNAINISKKYNINTLFRLRINLINNNKADFKRILDNFTENERKIIHYCEANTGNNFFYITPDLGLWKCLNDLLFEDSKVGFIKEDGKVQLNYKNLTKWYSTNQFNDKKCKECKLLPICFSSCPLYFLKNHKRICMPKEMAISPYLF